MTKKTTYDVVTDVDNGVYSVVDIDANAIYIYAENTCKLVGVIKNAGRKLSYHDQIAKTRKALDVFQGIAKLNSKHKKRAA